MFAFFANQMTISPRYFANSCTMFIVSNMFFGCIHLCNHHFELNNSAFVQGWRKQFESKSIWEWSLCKSKRRRIIKHRSILGRRCCQRRRRRRRFGIIVQQWFYTFRKSKHRTSNISDCHPCSGWVGNRSPYGTLRIKVDLGGYQSTPCCPVTYCAQTFETHSFHHFLFHFLIVYANPPDARRYCLCRKNSTRRGVSGGNGFVCCPPDIFLLPV